MYRSNLYHSLFPVYFISSIYCSLFSCTVLDVASHGASEYGYASAYMLRRIKTLICLFLSHCLERKKNNRNKFCF
jgi:hypothetical protein